MVAIVATTAAAAIATAALVVVVAAVVIVVVQRHRYFLYSIHHKQTFTSIKGVKLGQIFEGILALKACIFAHICLVNIVSECVTNFDVI